MADGTEVFMGRRRKTSSFSGTRKVTYKKQKCATNQPASFPIVSARKFDPIFSKVDKIIDQRFEVGIKCRERGFLGTGDDTRKKHIFRLITHGRWEPPRRFRQTTEISPTELFLPDCLFVYGLKKST